MNWLLKAVVRYKIYEQNNIIILWENNSLFCFDKSPTVPDKHYDPSKDIE